MRLDAHLAALGKEPASPARSTVAVVGAGFTGVEMIGELAEHGGVVHIDIRDGEPFFEFETAAELA